jgi:hypothetical protein
VKPRHESTNMEFSGESLHSDLRSATTEDVLAWRDRIVSEAAAHMDRSEVSEAVATLRRLEFSTIDDTTLQLTDPLFPRIVAGRKVVAAFDPNRTPAPDEVVIIYGNYPHMFGNVVGNNPIRRHVSDFWSFRHDYVESDPRWHGIDHIFIINATERRDRLDSVLRELSSARAPLDRVTRVAALKADSGEGDRVSGLIGCVRSHIEVLSRARVARYNHVLVLEDDFCFTSDLEQHLTDLRTFLERDYNYWICLVATSKYGAVVPEDDIVSLSYQRVTNTGGYLVSRDGLAQLLPVFERALEGLAATGDLCYAPDIYWGVLQQSNKFLCFRRKLGFQVSSFSDIERQISRYLD